MAKKRENHRLPSHARPVRYRITWEPDLDDFTFTGSEEIDIESAKAARAITLHSAELEITSASFSVGKIRMEGTVSYDDENERATITFPKAIPKGKGTLSLSFAGILNDKMRGFYRSRYEHEGVSRHMAVTQFESTDARRAFPCFDEPAHKAVFEVSLVVPDDRTAISNTLETEVTEHRAGYKLVRFAPSPKMSSYLLALIVGHFEHIETTTKDGTLVRVFVTPGKKHQAAFALECAAKCIEFYEKYFGIRYPLPAMDLIAIPDFAAGAMENWGAVTYRETAILVDPEHTAAANRERVALVIAHELAHQWFGNLVTMEWWTHLWLNEGFATYMEHVAIDAIFPEWKIWDHFVFTDHARALALDGLASTHAIEIEVRHPREIEEIFDAISYSKGAAIIRMLASYLSEPAFKKGLRAYLTKHRYGNATTLDLWRALEKASGKPVRKMMQGWTRKPGYPLVTVKELGPRTVLEQERFSGKGARKQPGTWFLPMDVSAEGKREHVILKGKKTVLRKSILKANLGETGFARVRYPEAVLERLEAGLASGTSGLSPSDRFGLIRDAFTFAKTGLMPTDKVLGLARAYGRETEYIVWAEIAEHLLSLRNLLSGKPEYEAFLAYGRALFAPAVHRIGWKKKPDEPHDAALLRSVLIRAAGAFGDAEVIARAKDLFWGENGDESLSPDLRAAVYATMAEHGGEREYQELLSRYRTEALEEEKDRLLRALCSFKDTHLLGQTLARAFSEEARGQDTLKAVSFSLANPYGRRAAWTYLKGKWPYLEKRFGGGHIFFRFIIPVANLTTGEEAKDVERFFGKQRSAGIERTAAQAVEQIRSHAAWYTRDRKRIARFLRAS